MVYSPAFPRARNPRQSGRYSIRVGQWSASEALTLAGQISDDLVVMVECFPYLQPTGSIN